MEASMLGNPAARFKFAAGARFAFTHVQRRPRR